MVYIEYMFPFQISLGRVLVGSVILSLISFYTIAVTNNDPEPQTGMYLYPQHGIVMIDKTFTVSVMVQSPIAVNAFSGQIAYDSTLLEVESINYNTSIANLWVEEPWYSAGNGQINYAGGTTIQGGFSGEGTLLEITFKPLAFGSAPVKLSDAHIFEHDGFGTEAVLSKTIDALFTIETIETQARTITNTSDIGIVDVVAGFSDFDINKDDKITLADASIFMLTIFSDNLRHDFNHDGKVDLTDLNLLLEARNIY